MTLTSGRISRRTLLRGTFAAGLGAGIVASLGAIAGFLVPLRKDLSQVRLGSVHSFLVGSKTLFTVDDDGNGPEALRVDLNAPAAELAATASASAGSRVWLVRLEQGFMALSARCTHLHCTVPWRPEFKFPDPASGQERTGWFRCPCHGSTFDSAGVRIYGPAPRSLDRFDVKIASGDVFIDFGSLRRGTPDNGKFAVDVEDREI